MVWQAFARGTAAGWWLRGLVVAVLLAVGGLAAGCEVGVGGRGQGVDPSPSGSLSSSGPSSGSARVAGPLLSSGGAATCVVRPSGQLVCWGDNSAAQLGVGVRSSPLGPVEAPGLGSGARGVSTGGDNTCVLASGGAVTCWGSNWAGQLGDGTTLDSVVPVAVSGLDAGVGAISVGYGHACALTAGGVKCWGANASGQLGDGTMIDRATPVDVTGLSEGVVALAAGWNHTCAVTTGGALKCWGANESGQLGDGTTPSADQPFLEEGQESEIDGAEVSRVLPTDVVGMSSGVAAVSAGSTHTCAVTTAGEVRCWGSNESGQLGVAALPRYDSKGRLLEGIAFSNVPLDVVGLTSPMVGVTVSATGHTCAWSASGDVSCWGDNARGQLGRGDVPTIDDSGELRSGITASGEPLDVAHLGMRAVAVTAGTLRTCALSAEGQVRCWGQTVGQPGSLGSNAAADGVPADVPWPSSVASTPKAVVVNLIVLTSRADLTSDLGPTERANQQAIAEQLIAGDPALLDAIRVGIRGAAWGRIDPRLRVSVAAEPLKVPKKCAAYYDNPQLIDKAARSHRVKGAIDVVVARASLCRSDGSSIDGYDSPEAMPVVGWSALTSAAQLAHVIVHEYGHDAGLKHAGEAYCKNPVTLTGCEVFSTSDSASVMSYDRTDTLSAPELHRLGLLAKGEVETVAARAGTAEFHLAALNGKGTKLVVVHLRAQKDVDTVYLSAGSGSVEVRLDPDATTREFVVKDSENYSGSLAVVPQDATPTPGEVLLRRLGVTITYQGLDAAAQPVVTVTRRS